MKILSPEQQQLMLLVGYESRKQFLSHLKQGKLRDADTCRPLINLLTERPYPSLWVGEKNGVSCMLRRSSKGFHISYLDFQGEQIVPKEKALAIANFGLK